MTEATANEKQSFKKGDRVIISGTSHAEDKEYKYYIGRHGEIGFNAGFLYCIQLDPQDGEDVGPYVGSVHVNDLEPEGTSAPAHHDQDKHTEFRVGDRVIISGCEDETAEVKEYIGRIAEVINVPSDSYTNIKTPGGSFFCLWNRNLSLYERKTEDDNLDIFQPKDEPKSDDSTEPRFKEGDKVIVSAKSPSDSMWAPEMDETLGRKGTITAVRENPKSITYTVDFGYNVWWYHEGSLSPIEYNETPMDREIDSIFEPEVEGSPMPPNTEPKEPYDGGLELARLIDQVEELNRRLESFSVEIHILPRQR